MAVQVVEEHKPQIGEDEGLAAEANHLEGETSAMLCLRREVVPCIVREDNYIDEKSQDTRLV